MIITVCVALLGFFFKKNPGKIFGVYSQNGKWYYLKYIVFACIYYFRKWTNKNVEAGSITGKAGQGVKALSTPEMMDRAQPLADHPKAFDAVFFISAKADDNDKGIYVIAGCERRPLGMFNGLFYIGLPDKGLLCSKKLPDTVLFGAEPWEFGSVSEGLMLTPVVPMKKWLVTYDGPMWYHSDPSKTVHVKFRGEWSASSGHFDYDSDLYPPVVIRSIAREPWTREYFAGLKTAHQSHYDQFGRMQCKIDIADETFNIELPSFRDHSFGFKRDWSLMHRYAFHQIFLENGTSLVAGVICQPSTATNFEVGEVCLPSGEILPVKWVDLQLYQHGEGGTAPRDYAFSMQAGREVYHIQVLVEYESIHYKTEEWEARMVERFCKYVVNGVPGRGVSEFHYRHHGGRPESAMQNDPQWYKERRRNASKATAYSS